MEYVQQHNDIDLPRAERLLYTLSTFLRFAPFLEIPPGIIGLAQDMDNG